MERTDQGHKVEPQAGPGERPAGRTGLDEVFGLASGGLLGGLLLWLLDAVQTAATGGGSGAWQAAVFLFAWYAGLGLAAGLGFGLLAASLRALAGPGWFRRLLEAVRSGGDATVASGVLAGAFSLALLALSVFLVHAKVSSRFQNQYLAAVFLALVAGGAGLFGLAAFVVLWAGLRRLFVALGWPKGRSLLASRTALAVDFVAMAAVIGSVLAVGQADWRILNLSAVAAVLGVPALALAGGVLWQRLAPSRRAAVAAVLAALLLAPGAFAWSARLLDQSASARTAVTDKSWAGGLFLSAARRLADRDGDGYAGSFGGGDCNDQNPKIHPGAQDIPGDGVDQDCLAGDALPPEKPVKVDRRQLAAEDPLKTFRFQGNFLVIIVDTLREDRLGIEKYRRKLTPNLDRFIASSVFFRKAYAQGNRTPHSFPSFLTSRYPSKIKWLKPGTNYSPVSDDNYMIFEALKEAGYRNVAILRHFYFHPRRNLQQGFAPGDWRNEPELSIKETNTDIAAPAVTERAIAALRELKAAGRPFALWVHYPDPHSRYMTHPEFPITLRGIPGLIQKYDYEIKFTDVYVGKLLRALEDLGLAKTTAVLLWSDHGEAFGKHRMKGKRMFFHGQTLYNEVLHVPLAIRVPGIRPRVVEDRVMLLDIAPTMVDMLGRKVPDSFMGSSLVPYFFGKKLPPRTIRAELLPYTAWKEHMLAVIQGKWKLIYRVTDNVFELYDLEADPDELHNVASKHRDVLERLKKELTRY